VGDLFGVTDQNLELAMRNPAALPDYGPDDFLPFVEAGLQEMRLRATGDAELEAVVEAKLLNNQVLGRPSRVRDSYEQLVEDHGRDVVTRGTVRDDLWWFGHPGFAQAAVADLTERMENKALAEYTSGDLSDLTALEAARYMRDPDYAGLGAAETLRASLERFPRSRALTFESYALLFEAWSAVRQGQGDVEGLVQQAEMIDRLGPSSGGGLNFCLPMAHLLEEYGAPAEALNWLNRFPVFTGQVDYRPEVWTMSGRLAEAAGDRERAIKEYWRYVTVRAHAGPELLPELERTRGELARLEAG
jgi:hypothetical protein